jgi:hypothetical protein
MLNVIALVTFYLAVATAALSLRQRLRPSGGFVGAGGLACVACGSPASALSTFSCPACRRDVREYGLAALRGRGGGGAATGPLWALLAWTAALGVVAGLLTALTYDRLAADYQDFQVDRQTSFLADSGGYTIIVHGGGSMLGGRPGPGTAAADLWVRGRGFASLEVRVPPLRGRVVDADGAELAPEASLDLPLVFKWFEAAGADPEDAVVDHQARQALWSIAADLRHPVQVLPSRKPLPVMSSMSNSIGGGSSSGRQLGPEWLGPSALIIWTAVWLAGAWLLPRWWTRLPNRRPAQPNTGVGDAPGCEPAGERGSS